MKSTPKLTAERLREVLHYDPETGVFTWIAKTHPSVRVEVGDEAGTLNMRGYIHIAVDRCVYKAHRLAWLYVYGVWPDTILDHINRRKTDNRIDNLRDCTQVENQQNRKNSVANRSGCKGVSWYKKNQKWGANIRTKGETIFLGLHTSFDDAVAARKAAEAKYHPYAVKDTQHA